MVRHRSLASLVADFFSGSSGLSKNNSDRYMRGLSRSNPPKVTKKMTVVPGSWMIYEKPYLIIRLVHNGAALANVYGDDRWSKKLSATTKSVKVS